MDIDEIDYIQEKLAKKEYHEVVKFLKPILKAEPDNYGVLAPLANSLTECSLFKQAKAICEDFIIKNPNNDNLWSVHAQIGYNYEVVGLKSYACNSYRIGIGIMVEEDSILDIYDRTRFEEVLERYHNLKDEDDDTKIYLQFTENMDDPFKPHPDNHKINFHNAILRLAKFNIEKNNIIEAGNIYSGLIDFDNNLDGHIGMIYLAWAKGKYSLAFEWLNQNFDQDSPVYKSWKECIDDPMNHQPAPP